MKKPRFRNKVKKIEVVPPAPLRFELEDNARELLENHIQQFKPPVKDADTERRQEVRKKAPKGPISIDLHGLTLDEAERELMQVIESRKLPGQSLSFKIITGKGRHSESGRGILVREIHSFVRMRYGPWIERIEESPDRVRLGGEALRGHFHVTIRFVS